MVGRVGYWYFLVIVLDLCKVRLYHHLYSYPHSEILDIVRSYLSSRPRVSIIFGDTRT